MTATAGSNGMSDWSGPEPRDSMIHDDGANAADAYGSPFVSVAIGTGTASATRITITAAAIGSMSALMFMAGWSQPKTAIGAVDLDRRDRVNASRMDATITSIGEEFASVSAQVERGAAVGLVNADEIAARAEQIALAARRAEWRAEILTLVGFAPHGEIGARVSGGNVDPTPAFSESKWNRLQKLGATLDAAESGSNTERPRTGERSTMGAAGGREP